MKEIKPLTSLRALAALLVFMYHYAWLFSPAKRGVAFAGEWIPMMPLWRQGQVGVSIFFVLSGFLITRIYFDKMATREIPLRLFYVKRIARIWPLFLAFALIEHTVHLIQGAHLTGSMLVTMSMTQGFFEQLRYSGLPTAWSLTIEENFYLLAPLIFLALLHLTGENGRAAEPLTARRLFRIVLSVGTLVALLLITGFALVRASSGLGWNWYGFMGSDHHMLHATLFGRFPEFALGVMAAFIHRGVNLEHLLRGRRADTAALLFFLAIGLSIWGKSAVEAYPTPAGRMTTYLLAYTVAILSAGLVLALTVTGGWVSRLLGLPVFNFLGKISYGFYLIQLTVIMTPLVALTDRLGWARLPVLLILTNAICAFTYLALEKPARRTIVARWGQRGPSPQPGHP